MDIDEIFAGDKHTKHFADLPKNLKILENICLYGKYSPNLTYFRYLIVGGSIKRGRGGGENVLEFVETKPVYGTTACANVVILQPLLYKCSKYDVIYYIIYLTSEFCP